MQHDWNAREAAMRENARECEVTHTWMSCAHRHGGGGGEEEREDYRKTTVAPLCHSGPPSFSNRHKRPGNEFKIMHLKIRGKCRGSDWLWLNLILARRANYSSLCFLETTLLHQLPQVPWGQLSRQIWFEEAYLWNGQLEAIIIHFTQNKAEPCADSW